jgi:hypothetical protein
MVRRTIHDAQPQTPNRPSFSSRRNEARIAPIMTDMAPSGVTRIAGAKVYAAKFATARYVSLHCSRPYMTHGRTLADDH